MELKEKSPVLPVDEKPTTSSQNDVINATKGNIENYLNRVVQGDCLEVLKRIPDKSIDLVLTSPPYDNLRTYRGNLQWNFEGTAKELYRVVKDGGVVVWVVGDATINGSETGTSFKQALYFKDIGMNIHDTMIWNKGAFSAVGALATRYCPVFEYMFVLTKGNIKTFNPLKDRKNKTFGDSIHGKIRQKDGSTRDMSGKNKKYIGEYGQRFNIWDIPAQRQRGLNTHPAPFPIQIAKDHILTWSNKDDIVLDPFAGSCTTAVACKELGRNYICIEKEQEYVNIGNGRLCAVSRA